MARKPRNLRKLLAEFEPILQAAFLAAIEEITSNIELQRLIDAIERKDIGAAMAAIHMEPAAFEAYRQAMGQAYIAGGTHGVGLIPRGPDGAQVIVRFDARADRAEDWLGRRGAAEVTRITEDQRNALQGALQDAVSAGQNPRNAALDIAGRIDPATGRRRGGLIGLTEQQKEFVRSARLELRDDPLEFLKRKLRDKRLDPLIRRAVREERSLTSTEVNKILGRYKDRMLLYRSETVARTESMASLHAGKHEAYLQAVDTGNISEDEIKRKWSSTGDTKVRHTHREMNGQERGLKEPYTTPSGASLMYPGDPDGPAEEIINCRCDEEYTIDFLARAVRSIRGA